MEGIALIICNKTGDYIRSIWRYSMLSHTVDANNLETAYKRFNEFHEYYDYLPLGDCSYSIDEIFECIAQLEYINRTGRPEMGMNWEEYEYEKKCSYINIYEMENLHKELKLKNKRYIESI